MTIQLCKVIVIAEFLNTIYVAVSFNSDVISNYLKVFEIYYVGDVSNPPLRKMDFLFSFETLNSNRKLTTKNPIILICV